MGRGSDLHKYIEFIEMSLGIAAKRILAAYQTTPTFSKPPTTLSSLVVVLLLLTFIKIVPLIYFTPITGRGRNLNMILPLSESVSHFVFLELYLLSF